MLRVPLLLVVVIADVSLSAIPGAILLYTIFDFPVVNTGAALVSSFGNSKTLRSVKSYFAIAVLVSERQSSRKMRTTNEAIREVPCPRYHVEFITLLEQFPDIFLSSILIPHPRQPILFSAQSSSELGWLR